MNWCEKHDHFKRSCPWCEIEELENEIQRLRAAAIKLHETLNTYWQGDCEKADVVAVQSKLCDVLGADRDDELYGDWTDELAEERAAHNAHVTELCEKEEECRKLWEERDKLIDGLRSLYQKIDAEHTEAHEKGDFDTADILGELCETVRDILHEIGVTEVTP